MTRTAISELFASCRVGKKQHGGSLASDSVLSAMETMPLEFTNQFGGMNLPPIGAPSPNNTVYPNASSSLMTSLAQPLATTHPYMNVATEPTYLSYFNPLLSN
jgi:hypothetical protein